MHYIFERLTTWLAPIMCFTMEEVWQARFPSEDKSVHMELYRGAREEWLNDELAKDFQAILEFRQEVNEKSEPLRKSGLIGSSLEVGISLDNFDEIFDERLERLGIRVENTYLDPSNPNDNLSDLLLISQVSFENRDESGQGIQISDLKADTSYKKCERSWKYFKGEGDITPRDKAAVAALG